MPVYEYRCKSCGKTHEAQHGFNDTRPTECPSCGGELIRVFHPIGLVFKGSGFHKTDYGGQSKRPSGESKSEDGKSSDATSGDAKSGEGKSGDAKSGESKPSESKPSDGKSSDAKSSDAKPSAPKTSGTTKNP
jgi:putative FmdB family regulatory protein